MRSRLLSQVWKFRVQTTAGKRIAVPAMMILVVANVALITGDLVAIGSGLELITGVNWLWFVLPIAAFLWYVTVLTGTLRIITMVTYVAVCLDSPVQQITL